MNNLEEIITEFNSLFPSAHNHKQLDEIRVKFLGKNGEIAKNFSALKTVSAEEKKSFGALINKARDEIQSKVDEKKEFLDNEELNKKLSEGRLDASEPTRRRHHGYTHPLSKTIKDVEEILASLGFKFEFGPEIEDDFHNFTALNIPKHHPARQMQDSFYLKNGDFLLRTHTSNTQIRKMLTSAPPLQIASLGKVFRRDSDQTHTPMFHQVEGFIVNESATMSELKWVLQEFLRKFFEVKNLELRFRPSFFPFTEPSAEVDIGYSINQGRIKIGSDEKFMEILGCGMIHKNVLQNCKIDPKKFQGFAFGIGIERLAMLKYGITDLRMFFENDVRFLENYGFKAFEF
jgi:phenylalanyl-tRNA synthetase alpha chain